MRESSETRRPASWAFVPHPDERRDAPGPEPDRQRDQGYAPGPGRRRFSAARSPSTPIPATSARPAREGFGPGIALRTQQVIAHESGAADSSPPRGSYFPPEVAHLVPSRSGSGSILRRAMSSAARLRLLRRAISSPKSSKCLREPEENREQGADRRGLNEYVERQAPPRFRLYAPPRRLGGPESPELRP